MTERTLQALAERDGDHGWVVRAPTVGVWTAIPVDGQLLDRVAGELRQGMQRSTLLLPDGVRGVVRAPASTHGELAVEWGQVLFRLEVGDVAAAAVSEVSAKKTAGVGELRSPTDGVFYVRPAPDAPPFVKAGDAVRRGQPVGLIEVMKTFNQILFEGDGLPEQAVVEEVLVGDGEEVRAGQALLRVGVGRAGS
jgi:acetyl-CoA carboxylase biotin carboxyl carrier protein